MLHQYLSDFESFDNFSSNLDENNKIQYQKLNLFKNDSFQEFDIDFEQKSTNIVNQPQQSHQEVSKKESSQTVTKKIKKSSKKDRNQKDYKKNICRNILRHAIKSMNNDQDCVSYISELVDDGKLFSIYYNRQLEQITGFRVLREHLVQMKEDSQIVRNRKQAFRQYLLWYLKSKATAMILRGETQNPQEYIRYKNEVLMYYIHRPHEWISNQPEWLNVATTGNEQQFQLNAEGQCI
ncbi:unnamed protein product (macronuclear) [Paramecium tetraurelia]|uniref:Uncharacterized protein n=1 Tax=Paramecium tetraurelia TaxID=5888 RepID=A0DJH7_PARTE|nr:uncharacterized protein GSPATT00017538001 [Paramecium tetraurelia]CAK83194.1 unnamed protein product [Paramecium tetraurelia]|eukprot:XP_001450591.1 hypothetical protein (macronuclear) [Paramecium tetraurelia strain d4-2]